MAKCPFLDRDFDIDLDDPCPVCGMLGTWHEVDRCVGSLDDFNRSIVDASPPVPHQQSAPVCGSSLPSGESDLVVTRDYSGADTRQNTTQEKT